MITDAEHYNERAGSIRQMIYAADMYLQEGDTARQYQQMVRELKAVLDKYPAKASDAHLIPWMNEPAWPALKAAILKDKDVILEAARLTGVEPRLIVSCLVGEQIRLFNSKREMYKQYLGPVKVLSVQSQFSFGVNGIKDFTARKVEDNLIDSSSVFYMGRKYEHILDFETENHAAERTSRLTDYPIISIRIFTQVAFCIKPCCSGNALDTIYPTVRISSVRSSTWDLRPQNRVTILSAAVPTSR